MIIYTKYTGCRQYDFNVHAAFKVNWTEGFFLRQADVDKADKAGPHGEHGLGRRRGDHAASGAMEPEVLVEPLETSEPETLAVQSDSEQLLGVRAILRRSRRAAPHQQVRKPPSCPRSWAASSPLSLYSHTDAWANWHRLGRPNSFLSADVLPGPLRPRRAGEPPLEHPAALPPALLLGCAFLPAPPLRCSLRCVYCCMERCLAVQEMIVRNNHAAFVYAQARASSPPPPPPSAAAARAAAGGTATGLCAPQPGSASSPSCSAVRRAPARP